MNATPCFWRIGGPVAIATAIAFGMVGCGKKSDVSQPPPIATIEPDEAGPFDGLAVPEMPTTPMAVPPPPSPNSSLGQRQQSPQVDRAIPIAAALLDEDTTDAPTQNRSGDRLTVAVLEFEDTSRTNELSGLGRSLQSFLTTDLSVSRDMQLVERARLDSVFAEINLGKTKFLEPATAAKLGKGVGAKAVLTGSFWIQNDEMRIDARLVHVETGQVILAEQIIGKSSEITQLEKRLANRIVEATGIRLSAFERADLSRPFTSNLLAASRYGQALLAEDVGDFVAAKKNAEAALRLDPKFALAERKLATIEDDALFRLERDQKRKSEVSGTVKQQLAKNREHLLTMARSEKKDAEYYASFLLLSVHAGLDGNADQERDLLFAFWEKFSETVPPGKCEDLANAIRKVVVHEGEKLRKIVDSGEYGMHLMASFGEPDPDYDPHASNLKPELRSILKWPMWSAVWPFDQDLRSTYGIQVSRGRIDKSWFDESLPRYPHDYLSKMTDEVWKLKREDPEQYEKVMRAMFSQCLYYNQMETLPAKLNEQVRALQDKVVWQLEDLSPQKYAAEFNREATQVLDVIGKVEPDIAKRDQANKLLLRFARQSRIFDGKSTDLSDAPASFSIYGETFNASVLILVRQSDFSSAIDPEKAGIRNSVDSELSDCIRSFNGKEVKLNVWWAESGSWVSHGGPTVTKLFPSSVDATNGNKQITLLSLVDENRDREKTKLAIGDLFSQLAKKHGSELAIVFDARVEDVKIPQSVIDNYANQQASPKVVILATAKNQSLMDLAIASAGEFVALRSKGGLLGGDDVTAVFVDLQQERAATSKAK